MLVVALSLLALPAAGQATFTVNTTIDNTTAGDTFCTLREAITGEDASCKRTPFRGTTPCDLL